MNQNEEKLHQRLERFRAASKAYVKFMAKVPDAGESNTVPASLNQEWGKVCAELQKAEIVLNRVVDSIVGSR